MIPSESSSPSSSQTREASPEPSMTPDEVPVDIAKIRERVEHILESYAAGKQLFPRSLLQDLDRQLALGNDCVHINDFDDVPQEYNLKIPDWCVGHA